MNEIDFIQPKKIVGKLISVDALDKIRAEIKDNRDEWIEGQDTAWLIYDRCLRIIDKYKSESEN